MINDAVSMNLRTRISLIEGLQSKLNTYKGTSSAGIRYERGCCKRGIGHGSKCKNTFGGLFKKRAVTRENLHYSRECRSVGYFEKV